MIITIFEERDFIDWCKKDIDNHKESIIERAYMLLNSNTLSQSKLKRNKTLQEIVLNNLDIININFQEVEEDKHIFNSCLVYRCTTIVYDEKEFHKKCESNKIQLPVFKEYLNKLSNYITDAAIVEWKLYRKLPFNSIKVAYPRSEHAGFFPISSNLNDLIYSIQVLSGKEIVFTPENIPRAIIGKNTITCYFTSDRLQSEYVIQQQLFDVYLHYKGYPDVDNYYFIEKQEWTYTKEELKKAINILIRNKMKNLLSTKVYPIFTDDNIYDLINFTFCEAYIYSICSYLCAYCRNNNICTSTETIEDECFETENCALYKENGLIHKIITLEDVSDEKKYTELINRLAEDIK